MEDFTLKYSLCELRQSKREVELREQKKHASIQRKIDQILDCIKKEGTYFTRLQCEVDDYEVSAAYDFLAKKGFKVKYDRGDITITV